MDFIAHDFWSGVYVVLLSIAGYVTFKGKNTDERRILYTMLANWIATRTFVSLALPSTFFFAADIATMVALLIYGKTDAAKVCSLIFFCIVSAGIALDAKLLSYSTVAAFWDVAGYLILLIMAGAANDFWTGKRIRLSNVWRNRAITGNSMLAVRRNTTASRHMADD